MKRLSMVPLLALFALAASCGSEQKSKSAEPVAFSDSNPFAKPSSLPFQAPDFSKIKDSDFKPAFIEGMKRQLAEIEKITATSEPATFENTLVPLERSGQLLSRVRNVFDLLSSANTNPTLQKIQEEIAPQLAAHRDAIFLNPKLFERIRTIYNKRNQLKLDPESKRLVTYYYEEFRLAGANLNADDKAKLKALNEEEAGLSAKFTNQLLAAAKAGALIVSDPLQLSGFTQRELDAAAQTAKENGNSGQWMIPLQNTTQQPALQSLSNRDLRKQLFEASWNRAEKGDSNDTRQTILRIAAIRAQKAKIMGYPNYAAWKLQDQMAKTPAAVDAFFAKLVPPATAKAKDEAQVIQDFIDKSGDDIELKPWDWNFYANKVRKEKYNLDEDAVKPYFELNNVLTKGVFFAANKLYGIYFEELHDLPVYQKDVRVFKVFDKDSTVIGLFYADYFKRENKSGGAWMSNLVGQSTLLGTKPVIYNVCNFTKPAPGQPALISFDDVTTMFHEFGHALHGFFASQKYPSLSGTNVARDFVEFPSQFNEHWAIDPVVFKNYAIHFKSGKPMPKDLVEKIKRAALFNQGYSLTEVIAAAALDLQWHKLSASDSVESVDAFEKKALEQTGLALENVPPRYRSSYFLHIWSNGYAAGYYAYLWTEMLDDDAFAWFEEHGGMTAENGQRFRDMILSKGNTKDLAEMYRAFRGKDPDIEAMKRSRGLTAAGDESAQASK